MPNKFKIRDNAKSYFITLNTVGWVDIFTKKEQKLLIIKSLNSFQKNRGLEIFSYCLMSNHLHMICRAKEGFDLSSILKDFKKKTSKAVVNEIKEGMEKRKAWLLEIFSKSVDHLKRNQKHKVWQGNNHAILIYSDDFLFQKIDYIHNDPIDDMIVSNPTEYLFSSARNYAGMEGLLDVDVLKLLP